MKIALDLNDVIRDYSNNFLRHYNENYDHTFDFSDFEMWSNDMRVVLPFKSDASYEKFTYQDYAYELYAACPTTYSSLTPDLNNWIEHDLKDIDTTEEIIPMIVSTMEYGLSIPSSYVFVGKLGSTIREIYFPIDSSTIWDRCDVVVTANPRLLESKPEGKISVKIETEYNKESESDFSFKSFKSFIKDKNNIIKLLKDGD